MRESLNTEGIRATFIASTGGFLRYRSTLLIGLEDEKVSLALKVLRITAQPTRKARKRKRLYSFCVQDYIQL